MKPRRCKSHFRPVSPGPCAPTLRVLKASGKFGERRKRGNEERAEGAEVWGQRGRSCPTAQGQRELSQPQASPGHLWGVGFLKPSQPCAWPGARAANPRARPKQQHRGDPRPWGAVSPWRGWMTSHPVPKQPRDAASGRAPRRQRQRPRTGRHAEAPVLRMIFPSTPCSPFPAFR